MQLFLPFGHFCFIFIVFQYFFRIFWRFSYVLEKFSNPSWRIEDNKYVVDFWDDVIVLSRDPCSCSIGFS